MEDFAKITRMSQSSGVGSKPLLGLTILLVEDSRYFSDAVRLLALHSGARIRRADSLTSARKHVKIYHPDIVLIDLGLPDGNGVDFIKEMNATKSVLVAMSGISTGSERVAAMEAGADCFLEKPFFDLASFQQTLLSLLPPDIAPRKFTPRIAGQRVEPESHALNEDLKTIHTKLCDALKSEDRTAMKYCAQFLKSVSRTAHDHELMDAASAVSSRLIGGNAWLEPAKLALSLVEARVALQPEINDSRL